MFFNSDFSKQATEVYFSEKQIHPTDKPLCFDNNTVQLCPA